MADNIVNGISSQVGVPAVKGEFTGTGPTYVHDGGKGVHGHSQNGWGVYGVSEVGRGVVASSDTNYGLRATSRTLAGARCSSETGVGVEGESHGAAPGIVGSSATGNGVEGRATGGIGIVGTSSGGVGVVGTSSGGIGVKGFSENFEGMHSETNSAQTAAIAAYNLNPAGTGAAIFAKKIGNKGHAGFFEGDVWVSGVLGVGKDIVLANADCAEDFDIADPVEPGTVMVLGDDEFLHQSSHPYDKRVAGVVSGAGEYKPGIVLDKKPYSVNRKPIALLGKVYCKVDADFGSIDVGDMLTTSSTQGHAMKANDPFSAFGAVIGKALKPLLTGKGLIPVLVALQ